MVSLQHEFSGWLADDSDDELYRVLEPFARAKRLLEDPESASNVVFFSFAQQDGKQIVIAEE